MRRLLATSFLLGRGLVLALLGTGAADAETPAVPRSDDPRRDGWETEAFQSAAGGRFSVVAGFLKAPAGAASVDGIRRLATADFAGTRLRPAGLREVFADGSIRVWRPDAAQQGQEESPFRGPDGLMAALRDFAEPLRGAGDVHAKFKIVRVELAAESASTRQLVSLSGAVAGGSVEQHATWDAEWSRRAGEPPRLRALRLRDGYQESRFSGADPSVSTQFTDRTAGVLAHNPSFAGQLMRGTWFWLGQLEASLGTDMMGHKGVAVGDVDGDGLEDLYAPQLGGLPNRLFLHREDGTADDRSAWAGVDWLDRGQSALLVDLDNDGDKDLVLGAAPALLLMANDGGGRFTPRAAFPGLSYAYSLAAADFDSDGDLDLYVSRYTPLSGESPSEDPGVVIDVPSPVPYHDAENGAPNFLLRNDGGWRFADATRETGMDADNRRWSFAASWEDFDNDGDPDLYVANDFGRNCLYRNDGPAGRPRFVNVAPEAGVEDVASGMSASWGDADRDGWMDLYVGNMFSSAGNRVTYQERFQPAMSAADRASVQRLARGNTLLMNGGSGGGAFTDASLAAEVTLGRWAWGSIFVDLNNDGWEDLVVANGYLTAPNPDDL